MFNKKYFNCESIVFYSLLSQKILTNRLLHITNLSTTIGAIATSLLFSQSVFAQSFSGYCISQENNNNIEKKELVSLSKNASSPKVTTTKGDRQYIISIDKINQKKLILRQVGEKSPIAQMTLAPEGGQIKNLVLGQDNWLWIDRSAVDYVIKINFSQKVASFDSLIRLPQLSAQPCHFLRRLLKKCRYGEYSYSHSLKSIFISGYPIKSWRKQNYLHLEFRAGEKKTVPEILNQATFVADIPEWNGALFRQSSGEALFYDGTKVTDLSSDFIQLENGKNFQDWDIRKTPGGRSFLGKFAGRTNNEPLFLMELKAKPGLKPVYLPEDFNNKWLNIFTFPSDPNSVLWIITRKAIFAEVKHKVKTVVSLPPLFFIKRSKLDSPDSIKQSSNNFFLFTVKKDQTKSSIDYLLQQMPIDDDCETMIDFKQRIILKKSQK